MKIPCGKKKKNTDVFGLFVVRVTKCSLVFCLVLGGDEWDTYLERVHVK